MLKYKHKGWKFQTVDVEAAFLDGGFLIPLFMAWPPGSVELEYVMEENQSRSCIILLDNIYGNVDAALRIYQLYSVYLIKMAS